MLLISINVFSTCFTALPPPLEIYGNAEKYEMCYSRNKGLIMDRKCPSGYSCKFKDEDLISNKNNPNKYCLSSYSYSKLVREGDACVVPGNSYIKLLCPIGTECKYDSNAHHYNKDVKICKRIINFDHDSVAHAGEYCYRDGWNKQKHCPKGFYCLKSDYQILNKKTYDESLRCRQIKTMAKVDLREGEECREKHVSKGIEYGEWRCEIGLVCGKYSKTCEKPYNKIEDIIEFARPGKTCYKSSPGYKRKQCTEGYTCRARNSFYLRPGITGISMVCLKIGTEPIFVQENQYCDKFKSHESFRLCRGGLSCEKIYGKNRRICVSRSNRCLHNEHLKLVNGKARCISKKRSNYQRYYYG